MKRRRKREWEITIIVLLWPHHTWKLFKTIYAIIRDKLAAAEKRFCVS